MAPPIDELETRENFIANMAFDIDLAERILELSVANGFLTVEFALQLIVTKQMVRSGNKS